MKLRRWVQNILTAIAIIATIVLASDCESLGLFMIIHFIALIVLIPTAMILFKYGRWEV